MLDGQLEVLVLVVVCILIFSSGRFPPGGCDQPV